jgi:O-antigen/teichoic acid export membrane protein
MCAPFVPLEPDLGSRIAEPESIIPKRLSRRDSGFYIDNAEFQEIIPFLALSLGVLKVSGTALGYISTRAIASLLGLAFAVLYSRQLGLTNRGYIAVIFTFAIVIISITLGGTTLTLRKLGLMNLKPRELKSFNSLISLEISLGLLLFSLSLGVYSSLKLAIPTSLLIASAIYFICSALHYVVLELLISRQQLKIAGLAEVTTVLTQIIIFLMFSKFDLFSTAVNLLLAFGSSYLFVSVLFFYITKLNQAMSFCFANPRTFFLFSKHHHFFGIALSLIDRIDRILIVILFSPTVISQYAAMSGILSVFRFIPDALGKISLNGLRIRPNRLKFKVWQFLFLAVFAYMTLIFLTREFITFTLGADWLLPISSFMAFCAYELARGTFQVSANRKMRAGLQKVSHRSSFWLFFLAPATLAILVPLFGLNGVPLGLASSYFFSLLLMKVARID